MARHVLLNNIDHKDLRVITRQSAEYGANIHVIPTFPTEFGDVQREYPIFFRRQGEGGGYQAVALLGLEPGENLFLQEDAWQASYVPGIIAKGPFLIGFQEQEVDGELRREPVIHVDLDDPRVNEDEGEALFLEHGGNAPYLSYVANVLRGIQEGMAVAKAMFAAFETYELIEPVNVEIDVHGDVKYELKGYFTISEERLRALPGEALERLNKAGFLQGAFMVLASLHNVGRLVEMKRERAKRPA